MEDEIEVDEGRTVKGGMIMKRMTQESMRMMKKEAMMNSTTKESNRP